MAMPQVPRDRLFGRENDLQRPRELIVGVRERGGAMIVRGAAGVGKSALLTELAGVASDRGLRVLTAAGIESETRLPFAGLHRILNSVLHSVPSLPAPQRDALQAAFGIAPVDAPPDLYLTALAALSLLADSATQE
jgi:hypothetical protein